MSGWLTETEIHLLDAEIARRVEVMIVPLRRRRNSLLPISRLPDELMQLIFSFSASHWNSSVQPISYSDSMSLSQVCKAWRLVALATGNMWSNISIAHSHLAKLFLSRSAHNLIHVDWNHEQQEKNLILTDGFEECVDAFTTALRHAERITSIEIYLPYEGVDFRLHLLPLIAKARPAFARLRYFSADFSGGIDGPLTSLDECFLGGASELTHLKLLQCQINPVTILAFSNLKSLRLPDIWLQPITISPQEWRNVLSFLSGTLEALSVDDQFIQQNDTTVIDLNCMQHLTLRGSVPTMEVALAGLRTPALRHLTLHIDGFGDGLDLHGGEFFSSWARIVNAQLSWDTMKSQDFWSLTLHSRDGISLRSVNSKHHEVEILLKFVIEDGPWDVAMFIQELEERTQQRLVELHVVMIPEIDGDVPWKDLPWAALGACMPNISLLELNEASFDSFFETSVHSFYYSQLSELHLRNINLSSEFSTEASNLLVSLSTRATRPECKAIRAIYLSAGCKLCRQTRNMFGQVSVFFDQEEVEWDPDRPWQWWGMECPWPR
jgi:hypothetical protein